jgi:hypothetical protein
MARRSSLEGRLLAVLSQKRNRRTVTGLIVVSSLLTGAAAAIPLAMLRAAEPIAQVDEKDDSAGKSPDDKTDIGEAAEVDRSATTKQTVSKTPPVDTETTLQWGKPVNGLRAALSRLPSVGEPKQGQVWDFDVVVQNVSDTPIRFVGDVTSPNIRRVTLRRDNKTLFRLISNEPSDVDVILQPREVVVLPVFPPNEAEKAKSMAENPAFTFHVMMKVEQAPAGAWTGELRTPDVSGAVI